MPGHEQVHLGFLGTDLDKLNLSERPQKILESAGSAEIVSNGNRQARNMVGGQQVGRR